MIELSDRDRDRLDVSLAHGPLELRDPRPLLRLAALTIDVLRLISNATELDRHVNRKTLHL
jgi:hypothetical protein